MPVLPSGDLFAPGAAVSGSKNTAAHCWKYCPYSTQITNYNEDSAIPEGDKVFHSETDGQLHSYSLGGPMGWICADNDCPFFTGVFAATTSGFEVPQQGRRFVPAPGTTACPEDLPTVSGSVEALSIGRTIVPGTRYYEI